MIIRAGRAALPERRRPSPEVAHGGLQRGGTAGERRDALAQQLEATAQPRAYGAFGQLEHLGELGRAHALEVVELERELQLERDAAQRL
jgi:hypothetical protein